MNSPPFDHSMRERFLADGFVAIPGFLGPSEVSETIDQTCRLIERVLPGIPAEQVFYEDRTDPRTLKQIQHLGTHDSWFEEIFTMGPFRALAERLLEGPVVPKNLQYFNKPPGCGQATPPHQDGFYFMLEPCEAVTMWLALDEVDEENGCVRYVRGSHRRGMRTHRRTRTLGFSQGIIDYPNDQDATDEIALPAGPGDLLVHSAMTIHRADANVSRSRSRRALGFIYYSARAVEDAVAHEEYQRALAREMKSEGKI